MKRQDGGQGTASAASRYNGHMAGRPAAIIAYCDAASAGCPDSSRAQGRSRGVVPSSWLRSGLLAIGPVNDQLGDVSKGRDSRSSHRKPGRGKYLVRPFQFLGEKHLSPELFQFLVQDNDRNFRAVEVFFLHGSKLLFFLVTRNAPRPSAPAAMPPQPGAQIVAERRGAQEEQFFHHGCGAGYWPLALSMTNWVMSQEGMEK